MRGLWSLRAAYRRFVQGDQLAGYVLLGAASRLLTPRFHLPESGRAWMEDEQFTSDYRRLTDGGLMDMADKKLLLRNLATWSRDVEGQIAECGSFRGVSSWFIAEATRDTGKVLHLFDSFEGLSTPGSHDGAHWHEGALAAGEQDCLRTLGPHAERAVIHRGWIPERFPDVADEQFSFVHVDVDLYEPHRDAIEFFWPRLTVGGLMVFDDYGSAYCPGARRAVDEAFASEDVVESPTAQAFVIKR